MFEDPTEPQSRPATEILPSESDMKRLASRGSSKASAGQSTAGVHLTPML